MTLKLMDKVTITGGGIRGDEYDTWVGAGERYLIVTGISKETVLVTAEGSLATWKVLKEQVNIWQG